MSFRKQLIIGIGALIAVMMFCAVLSVMTVWKTSENAEQTALRLFSELSEDHRIRVGGERLIAASRLYLVTGNETVHAKIFRLEARFLRDLARLRSRSQSAIVAMHTGIAGETARQYADAVLEVAKLREPHVGADWDKDLYTEHVAPRRDAFRFAIDGLGRADRIRLSNMAASSGHDVRVRGVLVVVGCTIGVAIGLALAAIVSRRLSGAYLRGQRAMLDARATAIARKEVLDMVSHDLRSPLYSILLGLELVQIEYGDLDHLEMIQRSARHMQTLVEDLLAASQSETKGLKLDRQPTSVRALLENMVALHAQRGVSAGVQLRITNLADATIDVDRDRVQQILSNLIGNAIAFTPAGGEVILAAFPRDEDWCRFEVRDTGPGIPPSERAALFEAFRQGTASVASSGGRRGSVGLGLYIARSLVHAHGGRIGVESESGEGSCFWFELPRRAG